MGSQGSRRVLPGLNLKTIASSLYDGAQTGSHGMEICGFNQKQIFPGLIYKGVNN